MTPIDNPLLVRARAAARTISEVVAHPPIVALVLGSGLSNIGRSLYTEFRSPASLLLDTPSASVAGHHGEVVVGILQGIRVIVFRGRLHLYEGHSPEEQTLPILLSSLLGAKFLVLTNASGGIKPDMVPGDLMIITDQINLTGRMVLPPGIRLIPHDVDVYDRELADLLSRASRAAGMAVHRGVYAGGLGPSYETPAEIRMLRTLGADAVGMSTVLEALAGKRLGLRVCGVSVVTNLATGMAAGKLSHDEVTSGAEAAGKRLQLLIDSFLMEISSREITAT